MNTEWACSHLERFIEMTRSRNASGGGVLTTRSLPAAPRDEVLAEWVVVERILQQVYPDWRQFHGGSQNFEFRAQRDAAVHALARIRTEQEVGENLGPSGPSLSSSSLHPWVWEAARPLWGDGHYRAAIQQAATSVDLQLQVLLDRRDCSGVDLIRQAFSTDAPDVGRPRLRVPDQGNAETTASLQQGMRALGEALVQAVRNPVSHQVSDLEEPQALECLALMSMFSRLVNECEVLSVD